MSKLKVAICDDEAPDLAHVTAMLQKYDVEGQMQTVTFSRACDLLENAAVAPLDIVLLDIEMEQPNGYEIAKELKALPSPPIIIFVTKSSAYTLQGYGLALRYLQKPLCRDAFFEAMDAAVQEATAHRLTIFCEDATVALRIPEILYIEMFGHYAVVHTRTREYRFRSSLKEIAAKLPKQCFAQPYKSIVVNLEHITSATNSEIVLVNGERVPISRRRLQEFNEAFYRFLGR